jgi:cobalt-zinc-cadmium efflux system outer membrane protein
VSQAYLNALEAREEVRVLAESAVSLRKEADIAAVRYHAGDIAASDQAQIEIAAAQLEMSATSARAAARNAVILLEILLNQPAPRGETELSDKLEALTGIAESKDTPVGPRPDVVAAEAGVTKAESDLKLQKRGVVPDMTVSLQFEHQPPDQPNTVGVGVSFPLPLWNRNTANILSAKAARDQMLAQLDKVRVQASADVAFARLANEDARVRAETYRRDLQPKSDSISKTVAYAYAKGGTSLVELLAAERNDNDIRLAAVRARADWLVASAALEAALNLSASLAPDHPTP